jgi:hypothetical protein
MHCFVGAPFLMHTYASHKCLPCDPGRSRVKLGHQLDQIEHIDHGYLNKKNQVIATKRYSHNSTTVPFNDLVSQLLFLRGI